MPRSCAFDIETVPDVRRASGGLHDLPADLPDARRRRARVPEAPRADRQRFPAAAPAARGRDLLRAARATRACRCSRSASPRRRGARRSSASSTASRSYVPQLVSWNGGGFDLPVLQLPRADPRRLGAAVLGHRRRQPDFRYNNYVCRFHARHLDLMDVLAMLPAARGAPLDEVAQLAGLPGQARHGRRAGVGDASARARSRRSATTARPTCANTYLLYLRFQLHARAPSTPAQLRARNAACCATALEKRSTSRTGANSSRSGRPDRSSIDALDAEGRGVARNARARSCSSRARCRASASRRGCFEASPSSTSARATAILRAVRRRGASRAARTSACAAAAPRSTPTRARRWPPSSAGWRTAWSASARSSPRRCCRPSTARNGATGTARACRCATSKARAARWSASASGSSTYVADMRELRGAAAARVAR